MDRDVSLAAGAHDGREELRLLRGLDVVGIEAVEVTDGDQVPAEREVGVGESARCRSVGAGAPDDRIGWRGVATAALAVRRRLRPRGLAVGRAGIKEALRFRKAGHKLHVARGLPGVAQSGLESNTRIFAACCRPSSGDQRPSRTPA